MANFGNVKRYALPYFMEDDLDKEFGRISLEFLYYITLYVAIIWYSIQIEEKNVIFHPFATFAQHDILKTKIRSDEITPNSAYTIV